MIILFCFIVCIGMLVYGVLVLSRVYTPVRAKVMVEEEGLEKWCKAEGFIRILWGLDAAIFGVYYSKVFLPTLCLVCFIALTIYTIMITYKNNQKYMK